MKGALITFGIAVEPPHVMPRATWERMQAAEPALNTAGVTATRTSTEFKKLSRALDVSRASPPQK